MNKKIFDIAAKLIEPSTRAWVVHAGRSQLNYKDFVSGNQVFLEVPHIEIDKSILALRTSIRRALRRSIEWRKHYQTTGSAAPSNLLSSYKGTPFEDHALRALSGSISRLYGQAKKGDIVIVPGRENIRGINVPVIRFGEILSDFSTQDIFAGSRPDNQSVPFRRVKWLNVVPRKEVSLHLERKIGKPPAIREIKIDRDTEEILNHTYESYIFSGNSSGLITADKYEGSDFVTLNRSSELIAFLVSAHAAFSNNATAPQQIVDIEKFTQQYFSAASVENIVVDFASPGFWRIVGASVSLAAFVALGVAVFSSGLPTSALTQGIEVTNSIAPSDQTALALEQSMNHLLKSMDNLQIDRMVKSATDAKRTIGLQSSAKSVN